MSLWLAKNGLRIPDNQRVHSIALWCEFGVFGLSIYDDQTPWFTLIEFIQIASSRRTAGIPIFCGLDIDQGTGEPEHERLSYSVPPNTYLRHLLFRDREISRLASKPTAAPESLWDNWLEHAKREFSGSGMTFDYLRDRFQHDFYQMAEAIDLLRSAEVEKYGARRWTSRHLAPLGRSMLFPDVKQTSSEDFALDRRFFQRTGELLYLMLNRSSLRHELDLLIKRSLLTEANPLNRLAKLLQPQPDDGHKDVYSPNVGYLPIAKMEVYDRLAADWIAILGLKSLPLEDCLDALMRLSGLHEIAYIVERAVDEAGRPSVPPLVLDLAGTARNNPVFGVATESYKTHRSLPMKAIEAYIDRFASSAEWTGVGSDLTGAENARQLLKQRFLWAPKHTANPSHLESPGAQLERLREEMRARNHDVGSALTAHARRIGLLAAQRRAGTWYSPTDGLLEALVLANVTTAVEFGAFLKILRRRYNVVVGPEEARGPEGSLLAPLAALRRNEQRLEERLRVLGFIDRKSDDCAFVLNPFYRR